VRRAVGERLHVRVTVVILVEERHDLVVRISRIVPEEQACASVVENLGMRLLEIQGDPECRHDRVVVCLADNESPLLDLRVRSRCGRDGVLRYVLRGILLVGAARPERLAERNWTLSSWISVHTM